MIQLALIPWAKLAILAALAAAAVVGYFAWADHIGDEREASVTARYEAALGKQKAEAAAQLAAEAAKTRAAEGALRQFKDQQELVDGKNQTTVADLERRLRAAGGPGQRLRDPNAAGCGGGGGGSANPIAARSGDRPADPAEGAWLLSKELTGLLQWLTREADEINLAYISCRADSLNVRGASP